MIENLLSVPAPASRGGMCKNPFGNATRIDRIDLFDFAGGSDSPIKMLCLKVISDAVSDYLFYALGKNGTVVDDFWYATEYFFNVRSDRPESWIHARQMRNSYIDDNGKKVTRDLLLSDAELKLCCFDHHYTMAELDKWMPMDLFVDWLRGRREEILRENAEQVHAYIDLVQRTALRSIPSGVQIPFKLDSADRMQVLVQPDTPEQIAELVYYSSRKRKSSCARMRRPAQVISFPKPRIAPVAGQYAFQLAS